MSDTPWIKFYASDWLAGTSGLSAAERGVYITIVCLIYETEGPILLDVAHLARRCGTTRAAFDRSLKVLLGYRKLILVDGRLTNGRAAKELSSRAIRVEKARGSARERWAKDEQKSKQKQHMANASASVEQCLSDAIQNQSPEPDGEATAPPGARRPEHGTVEEAEARGAHRSGEGLRGAASRQGDGMPGASSGTGPLGGTASGDGSMVGAGAQDDPRTWSDDRLWEEVVAAVGHGCGPLPTYWQPPAAIHHVGRWRRDLGLDPQSIANAARESRRHHTVPPDGPKALDGVMRRLASELRAPPIRVELSRQEGNAGQRPEDPDARNRRWAKYTNGYDDPTPHRAASG